MNEEKARAILGEAVRHNDCLYNLGHYISWTPRDAQVVLDDDFSADELEAIAWWMRNKKYKGEPK